MSTKTVATKFGSFVRKYAVEASLVAGALNSILDGLALTSKEAAKVRDAISKLEAAVQAIANADNDYVIKIDAKDITTAVNAWLDKNGAAIIEATLKANASDNGK